MLHIEIVFADGIVCFPILVFINIVMISIKADLIIDIGPKPVSIPACHRVKYEFVVVILTGCYEGLAPVLESKIWTKVQIHSE